MKLQMDGAGNSCVNDASNEVKPTVHTKRT
jgi:hypothetical protein